MEEAERGEAPRDSLLLVPNITRSCPLNAGLLHFRRDRAPTPATAPSHLDLHPQQHRPMPRGPHARRAWRADGDVRRAPASAASVERDTLLHSAELAAPASLASPGTPLRGPRLSPFAAPGRAGPGLSRLARTPPRGPRLSRPLWLMPGVCTWSPWTGGSLSSRAHVHTCVPLKGSETILTSPLVPMDRGSLRSWSPWTGAP